MGGNNLNNEPALLALMATGNEAAYTTIYRHYSRLVYDAALVYVKQPAVAREIVQEVFIKVWDKRERFREVDHLKDYLYILARNCIYDRFRKAAVEYCAQQALMKEQPAAVSDADHRLQEQQYTRLLQAAVNALPPRRKRIYLLAKEEGLSYNEIAGIMHVSRFTVKNQMAQALQFIRAYLDRHLNLAVGWQFWLAPWLCYFLQQYR